MNKNSNLYTFIFAVVMVCVIAGLLSLAATELKPLQQKNVRAEKMQKMLATIGVEVSRDKADVTFNKYIKKQLALKTDGSVDGSVSAFDIELKKEIKKKDIEQRFPLYIAEKQGKIYYIIPLYGAGLWDAIWGYLALQDDKNTIFGTNFDHKGETPGLGAEITTGWFQKQFEGKKILRSDFVADSKKHVDLKGKKLLFAMDNFVSVKTVKGGAKGDDTHGVDAISGGTITSDGVSEMIAERLKHYLPYFKNN